MNKEVMFSSKTDVWETPQDFFDKLNDDSEYCADWTDYADSCEDWEGKE